MLSSYLKRKRYKEKKMREVLDNGYIEEILVDNYLTSDADTIRMFLSTMYKDKSICHALVDLMTFHVKNYSSRFLTGDLAGVQRVSLKLTLVSDTDGGFRSLTPRKQKFLSHDAYDTMCYMIRRSFKDFEEPTISHFVGLMSNFFKKLEERIFKDFSDIKGFRKVELLISNIDDKLVIRAKDQ